MSKHETRGHPPDRALESAVDLVKQAKKIVVLTGAGVSTESGIPDFRGPQGLWTRDPEAEKLSDISYYLADSGIRKKAWRARLDSPVWYAQPGRGHLAIVELEKQGKLDTLITQNTDGLHQIAGNSAARVIEIHGSMRDVVCLSCGMRETAEPTLERIRNGEEDPECLSCGGILKSATISFGQALIEDDLKRAERAANNTDLLLAVGSTLAVYPIAGIVPLVRQKGTPVVIVNGSETQMDDLADIVLHGGIGEIMPRLVSG